ASTRRWDRASTPEPRICRTKSAGTTALSMCSAGPRTAAARSITDGFTTPSTYIRRAGRNRRRKPLPYRARGSTIVDPSLILPEAAQASAARERSPMIARTSIAFASLALASCVHAQLTENTLEAASTVETLRFEQLLNNISDTIDAEDRVPSSVIINTGQAQI